MNVLGCKRDNYAYYYDKSPKKWNQYINEISSGKISSLKNTVLLILTTNECSPSLDEIKGWSKYKNKGNSSINVGMIILEKYSTTINVLLEQESINLPVYQDSSYKIIEKGLLPRTPIKVYFGEDGSVKKMRRIGEDVDPNSFITEE